MKKANSLKNLKTSPIFEKLEFFSDSFEMEENFHKSTSTALSSQWNDLSNQETPIVQNNTSSISVSTQKQEENEFSMVENSNPAPLTPSELNGYSKIQELKLVKVGLASSEKIMEWAEKILPNGKIFGEVLNANTLHYKTFKPHKGGLFCERIFGPLKDFECACGKKQKPMDEDGYVQNILNTKSSKRVFCPECDVEYTWSVIRRYQLGYIKLVSPVSHLWYLRTNPSYLSLLLDIRKQNLESIIYCMQITTLEYYWRPLHSLQLNLTPTTLLNTYNKYLALSKQKSETENNIYTLKLQRKKQKELDKREKFRVFKQDASSAAATFETLKSLEDGSLESKIQFLEKSYQLSSENYSKPFFKKKTRAKDFLTQKIRQESKKTNFSFLYKNILERFYEEIYLLISRRHFLNLFEKRKRSLVSSSNKLVENNVKRGNSPLKENSASSMLKLVLKNYLHGSKKKSFKAVNKQKLLQSLQPSTQHFQEFPVWQTSSTYFSKQFRRSLTNKTNSTFLPQFVKLLRKSEIHKPWLSLFLTTKRKSLELISQFKNSLWTKSKPVNVEKLFGNQSLETFLFLYFLVIIQESKNLSLKTQNQKLLNSYFVTQFLLTMASENKVFNSPNIYCFGFLSDWLHVTLLPEENSSKIHFFEIEKILQTPTTNFLNYLNILINKLTNLLNQKSFSVKKKKDLQKNSQKFRIVLGVEPLTTEKILAHKLDPLIYDKKFYKKHFLTNTVPSKVHHVLFNQLSLQKKIDSFSRLDSNYISDFTFYNKNKSSLTKKLAVYKQKSKQSSLKLFNNIYTVAYSKGWQTDKEWRYFLFYNTAPIEMLDQRLSCYKHRFASESLMDSSFSTAIPILGANLIQKLLGQYEGFELKKMAKQHQNLLPKLNRYIRHRKQIAVKKSDFVFIQKLLQKRDQIIRRLKLLRKLFKKNVKPTATILTTLPVLPPDLRPILKMQNQIAASDLNRFYQRILYRNERLKKFLRANASMLNYEPGFELKYAQRLLQEAVDNLIQNGKGNVKPETNSRGQALKSLSEILKGKQGRFRQYLLGKRVDYSGRSVIVVGPTLKIHQCGLPFEMAIELFLPFLIKRIFQYKLARTVIGAKTILKTQKKTTWYLLEEIMKNHPILLNRAPTLHRLGIQAFQPKLIEGRAILLHPLVCPAFNADFDGDQMAVHVPITVEARAEAWKLMFSRNHLISPATGEPMLLPTQDMVLGCYYLTTETFQIRRFHSGRPFSSGTRFYFSNKEQVMQAYQQQRIHLQTPIWFKWNGKVETESHLSQPLEIRLDLEGSWTELRPKVQKRFTSQGSCQMCYVRTTAGRILFNTLIENCIQDH